MARTTGRSGFKLKSSPNKIFGNFFKGLKVKKTGDIGEELKSKYSSKAQRADEVPRHGESKYQFDVRTRKARRARKPKVGEFTTERKLGGDLVVNQELINKKVSEPESTEISETREIPWDKAPKVGTQARTNWYIEHDLELDPTTPGFEDTDPSYKIIKGKYGPVSVIDDNPIPKKSPYKKGIGKYAKKAKGSRGYTMKRNK